MSLLFLVIVDVEAKEKERGKEDCKMKSREGHVVNGGRLNRFEFESADRFLVQLVTSTYSYEEKDD